MLDIGVPMKILFNNSSYYPIRSTFKPRNMSVYQSNYSPNSIAITRNLSILELNGKVSENSKLLRFTVSKEWEESSFIDSNLNWRSEGRCWWLNSWLRVRKK